LMTDYECQTCGGVVTHLMCDKCYWNNITNTLQEELKAERERVLKELKEDLHNRFISSSGNQWSKGRNSGLLECCNIIDESLRSEP